MLVKSFYYSLRLKKRVWIGGNATILGLDNIDVNGRLDVGIIYNCFSSCRDKIILDVDGSLVTGEYVSFGDGSVVKVARGGEVIFGKVFLGPRLKLFSKNRVSIGSNVSISWDVTILDTSFHEIVGGGRNDQSVIIEDDVWIGANAIILPGSRIRKGSVVAAGAVVSKDFSEDRVLIGGNPSKILKRNIKWNL